jgi:hypothetical protein
MSFARNNFSFPLRGKVGMGHLAHEQLLAVYSFPLRGKVGMGVVLKNAKTNRTLTSHCPPAAPQSH